MRRAPAGRAASALVAIALSAASAAVADEATPITVEDLLGATGLGDAWFSPDGRSLAYSREISSNQIVTTGYSDPSLFRQQVFVAELAGGAEQQIVPPRGSSLRVAAGQAWSPDGSRLLLLQADAHEYRLAVWDRRTRKTVVLPGRPGSTFTVSDWAGDRLVYAVAADDAPQRFSKLQMLETLTRRWRATWTGGPAQITVSSANPALEPPAPQRGALMLATPSGEGQLAARGDYVAVSVSPDRRHVATVALAEHVPEPFYPFGGRGELQLFELTSAGLRLEKRFTDFDASFQALSWAPSSDRLLVGAKPVAAGLADGRLYEVSLRGMAISKLVSDGVSFQDPSIQSLHGFLQIGWIGGRPAAIGTRPAKTQHPADKRARLDNGETAALRFDLYLFDGASPRNLTGFAGSSTLQFVSEDEADAALLIADGGLWRVSAAREQSRVSPAAEQALAGFATDPHYPQPPVGTARFHDNDHDRVALWRVDATGTSRRVVLDLRHADSQVLPENGDFLAGSGDLASAATTTRDGWSTSLTVEGAHARAVATVNAALRERALAPARTFSFEAGGRALSGWFVPPLHGSGAAPAPAVMVVYGGEVFGGDPPRAVTATVSAPMFNAQLLSAQGYGVIYPSMPLGAAADTDQAAVLAEQAVAAVDALAAQGLVDPKRVVVMGQSFGAYSTAAILAKRSDRFAAGIAMAGIYDWMMGHGAKPLDQILSDDGRNQSVEALLIEQGQGRFGKPFWDDPKSYIRNSPIFHVRDLDAPLLMLQGDLDFATSSITGADRMYASLVRAGKKPTLVRYWGEGHLAYSGQAIRDQWSRVKAWLDTYTSSRERLSESARPRAGTVSRPRSSVIDDVSALTDRMEK